MTSYEKDCNTCICFNNETFCTEIYCGETTDNILDTKIKSAPLLLNKRLPQELPCKEGSIRKRDCNTCVCMGSLEFCTLKLCPEDICKQPIETGPCLAAIRRFAFNSQNGRCEEFTYGGFAAEAELEQRNICLLPTVTGPCRAYIPRFSFNPRVNRCGPFIYGGCGGNENNFLTFDACFARCGKGDPGYFIYAGNHRKWTLPWVI
ncbi:Protein AMBP, partial [Armadillidium vulgare]